MWKGKEQKQLSNEEIRHLRGNERVFQLCRDTFLIYTGTSTADTFPFVRVGSGDKIYDQWSSWVGHVIVADDFPANIGHEIKWMQDAVAKGFGTIKYVGGKRILDQFYIITGMPALEEKNIKLPMDRVLYGRMNGHQQKRHVYAVQNRDNFTIEVDGKKIFDFEDRKKRSVLSLSEECHIFSEALVKFPYRKANNNKYVSMVWIPQSKASASNSNLRPTLYWNCYGKGFVIEPTINLHYSLFACGIDPQTISGFSSVNATSPGLNEGLWLSHMQSKSTAIDVVDENQYALLKKFYNKADLRYLTAGVALPFAKEMFLSKSRRGHYSAISWRYETNSDHFVNVLFPTRKSVGKKKIENIRPPYDIEIQRIDEQEDFKQKVANLRLQFAGNLETASFERVHLEFGTYPLLSGVEYIFHQHLDYKNHAAAILHCFQECKYANALKQIMQFHYLTQQPEDNDYIKQSLQELLHIHRSIGDSSIIELLNINSFVNVLKYSNVYPSYTKSQNKLYRQVEKKVSIHHLRYERLIEFNKNYLRGHILCFGQKEKRSALFLENISVQLLNWHLPTWDHSDGNRMAQYKEYSKKLQRWQRQVERKPVYAPYTYIVEALEKIHLRKQYFIEQWQSFEILLGKLGASTESKNIFGVTSYGDSNSRKKLFLDKFTLTNWLSIKKIRSSIAQNKAIVWIVVLLLGLYGVGKMTFLATDNDTRLFELVSAGVIQDDEELLGTDQIETTSVEIFTYANILANKNNFQPLGKNDGNVAGKRNPNLVYPSDLLKLPDDRLARVKKGEYIWEIAENQYRQDFARLLFFEKQLRDNKNSKKSQEYLSWARRLAVTPKMKEVLARINSSQISKD